jgi:hypothetical protein
MLTRSRTRTLSIWPYRQPGGEPEEGKCRSRNEPDSGSAEHSRIMPEMAVRISSQHWISG